MTKYKFKKLIQILFYIFLLTIFIFKNCFFIVTILMDIADPAEEIILESPSLLPVVIPVILVAAVVVIATVLIIKAVKKKK